MAAHCVLALGAHAPRPDARLSATGPRPYGQGSSQFDISEGELRWQVSTRILGRRTSPSPPSLVPHRAPRGLTRKTSYSGAGLHLSRHRFIGRAVLLLLDSAGGGLHVRSGHHDAHAGEQSPSKPNQHCALPAPTPAPAPPAPAPAPGCVPLAPAGAIALLTPAAHA